MSDQLETAIIHAARMDSAGNLWTQQQPGGVWRNWLYQSDFDVLDLEAGVGPTRPVRIVTTDPDDDYDAIGELRARVAELETDLADEKAAHAKTRRNFAEHVGQEFPPPRDQIGDDEFAAFNRELRSLRQPTGLSAEHVGAEFPPPFDAIARPGDTLIVRVNPRTTAKEAQWLREQAAEKLPELKVVIVAAEQAIVVQRDGRVPDAEA